MSFFARPAPLESRDRALQPAKRVASPIVVVAGPSKRVKISSNSSSPAASDKTRERQPLTPHASSDGPSPDADHGAMSAAHRDASKPSSYPAHATLRRAPPTPGTSTVAASSSPRRLALSSSPRMGAARLKPHTDVVLDDTTTLVFGRHRPHRVGPGVHAAPTSLVPRLVFPDRPARTICLDRGARHASRVHAAAERTASGIRLLVLGQNGVKVKFAGVRRRLMTGTVEEFDGPVEVDFYGATVAIRVQELEMEVEEDEDEERERALFTPEPIVHRRAVTPLSLPPSSPPVLAEHFSEEEEEEDEEDEPMLGEPIVLAPTPGAASGSPSSSRASSPLSDCDDFPAPAAPITPAAPAFLSGPAPTPGMSSPPPRSSPAPAGIQVKKELVASTEDIVKPASRPASRVGTPAPTHGAKSRPATPPLEIPPPPADMDLAALLVNTIVFSGSSKLSLPDMVKMMLESQPSLRDKGNDAVWTAWCRDELDENPMFGKVARNGKDSSGRPLQSHYFYNAASDPDPARAKELGGLVRPLRAAQRAGGKAIDWRPVGAGRRRYY